MVTGRGRRARRTKTPTEREVRQGIKAVVRACRPALRESVGITALAGCGAQGCVYHTHARERVVKVSIQTRGPDYPQYGKMEDESGPMMWLLQFRYRSHEPPHSALPRVYSIGVLENCAEPLSARNKAIVGERAFVVEREEVEKLKPSSQLLDDLLREVCDWTFAGRDPATFMARNRRTHRGVLDPMHRAVFGMILSLHIWLWRRGLKLGDAWGPNIGLRPRSYLKRFPPMVKVPERDDPYGESFLIRVVVRDLGLLKPRTNAPAWVKECWKGDVASHHALPLGLL